jgi:hypothetical protein
VQENTTVYTANYPRSNGSTVDSLQIVAYISKIESVKFLFVEKALKNRVYKNSQHSWQELKGISRKYIVIT